MGFGYRPHFYYIPLHLNYISLHLKSIKKWLLYLTFIVNVKGLLALKIKYNEFDRNDLKYGVKN